MRTLPFVPIFALSAAFAHTASAAEIDITQFELAPTVTLEFLDNGQGGTRYGISATSDLLDWTPVPSSAVQILGGGIYEIGGGAPSDDDRKFYRVEATRVPAVLGFRLAELQVDEGSGQQSVTVEFTDSEGLPIIYNGAVNYEWAGGEGIVDGLTGTVTASGTEAEIPLNVLENLANEPLRQLQLRLTVDEDGSDRIDAAASALEVTIQENDSFWSGSFETGAESIELSVYIQFHPAGVWAGLQNGTTFVPKFGRSVAESPVFSPEDGDLHFDFPPVALTGSAENLVADGTQVALVLTADDSVAGQTVNAGELVGTGTLTISHPDKPHLTTPVSGTFLLRRDPVRPPTGEIEFD